MAALAVRSILSQESIDAKPSFSVASVKPAAADARLGVAIQSGGRFIASGAQLKLLIALAYHVTAFQMSGGEGWMVNDRWNIEANSEGLKSFAALIEFRDRYDRQWILQRLKYRTPAQARQDSLIDMKIAARFNESAYSHRTVHPVRRYTTLQRS